MTRNERGVTFQNKTGSLETKTRCNVALWECFTCGSVFMHHVNLEIVQDRKVKDINDI